MERPPSGPALASPLSGAHLWAALRLLEEAAVRAREAACDEWQFAIELAELRAAGVSCTDLRWLAWCGYVWHGRECTRPGDRRRRFRPAANLAFHRRSCFVLTESGGQLARERASGPAAAPPSPCWDGRLRRLTVNGWLVKQFRLPAANQETILTALQETGWPPRIDDPLPPVGELDPKVRLHDAIKGLNRRQLHRLLLFRGDGSGQGVLWESVPSPSPGLPQSAP